MQVSLKVYFIVATLSLVTAVQFQHALNVSGKAVAPSLATILKESGTDKLWRHGYHRYYETKLAPYRDTDGLRLLEIGAKKGKSLNTWMQYFSNPGAIHSIAYRADVVAARAEACAQMSEDACSILKIFDLDQSDRGGLRMLCSNEALGWDIVIDDGSHLPRHQLISFEELFPHVRPGGLYVIEDIESSYVDDGTAIYGYDIIDGGVGKPPPGNAVEKFKQLVDVINRRHFSHPDFSVMSGIDKDVVEVSFADGLIFVFKKPDDGAWGDYPRKLTDINEATHSDKTVREWLASPDVTARP